MKTHTPAISAVLVILGLAGSTPRMLPAAIITTTTLSSFEFQTAADNGESPATTAAFAGAELFVRERGNEDNPENEVQAFLRFDLSSLSDDAILSATLNLHQFDRLNTANGNAPLFISLVTEDWSVNGPVPPKPTFNQSGGTTTIAGEFQFGDNGPTGSAATDIDFAIDVTDWVAFWLNNPDDNFGMRLRIDDNFVGAAFDHTGLDAPTLVVEQIFIPEPSTGTAVLLGMTGLLAVRRRRIIGRAQT